MVREPQTGGADPLGFDGCHHFGDARAHGGPYLTAWNHGLDQAANCAVVRMICGVSIICVLRSCDLAIRWLLPAACIKESVCAV